jgi:heme-degrading monooxygenase HmoA
MIPASSGRRQIAPGDALAYSLGALKGTAPMIAIIWSYAVREEARAAFEAAYGPDGDWATLFAKAEGYVRTELLKGADDGYLTIDYWTEQAAWNAFAEAHADDYRALDAATEALTEAEERIGGFTLVPGR